MGGFNPIFGFDDDDQLNQRRQLGEHPMIAGPDARRTPAELPGIDVPNIGGSGQPTSGAENSAKSRNSANSGNSLSSENSPQPVMAGPGMNTSTMPSVPASMAPPRLDPLEADRTQHQTELSRLRSTGSGISQIHNPLLRGMARVGDIAGSMFFPFQMRDLPGTEFHHRSLINNETAAINQDQNEEQKRAQIGQEEASAEHQREETKKTEADLNAPLAQTPEEQAFESELKKNGGDAMAAFRAVKQAAEKPVQPKEGEMPLGDRVGQLNQMLSTRYQVLNPGQQLPQQYMLPPNATQKDYDRIDKGLEAEERARGTKAQQDQVNEMRREARENTNQTRQSSDLEKSYNTQSKRLDTMSKPITDAVQRLGHLQDTLRQGTPQADALVAPELLTVMAGGAGSGLRMNEAEIARVLGGRSHWESLKAAVQQWSADPKTANSITPEQRQQIHTLIDLVNKKLLAKQAILNDADEKLLDTDDPLEHKRIVVRAKQALSAIDEGRDPGVAGSDGGGIHYREGNVDYDIPPEKEAEFLKKHPKAVKQ